jgi:transcriptional regulator with XRE-family HTH domain
MPTTGPDLAGAITARREELGLSKSAAARAAGVSRPAWDAWENGTIPYDSNWATIERALQWERGSIRAILNGGTPTPRPSTDADAAPAGFDPKEWATWDPIDREMILNAIKIARRRVAKNHPDEGTRPPRSGA